VSTEPNTEPVAARRPLPRRIGLLVAAAGTALLLDIVSKTLVVADIEGQPPVKLAAGLVYLDVIRNPYAAFSLGVTGMTWVFSVICVGVLVAIIWVAPKLRSRGWAIGLGLVFGGALGNLLDRVFRSPGALQGHVVDFISVFGPNGQYFAIFNLADSAICVGGALIVLMAVLGRDYDGRPTRAKDKPEPASE
jgi:signal peptidase II